MFSLRTCAYLFVASLLLGTLGYIFIEGYSLGEAVYMTIITISTVGFSEVKELSPAGRSFTSVFVLINLGITALFLSQLTQHLANGGVLTQLRNYLMNLQIDQLSGHVIVCGAGRYGREIIDQLHDSEEDVVLVECSADRIAELSRDFEELCSVHGDATHDETLERARIAHAKSIIMTVGDDSDNVLAVLTARALNPSITVIARVYSPENRSKLLQVGANHVVQPEQLGGFMMATLVRKPSAVEFFTTLASGPSAEVGFEEVAFRRLPKEFQNQSLLELDLRRLTGVSIVALRYPDGRYEVNPDPQKQVEEGMSFIALGDRAQLSKLQKLVGWDE